jgi:hypothetical protein
MALLLSIGARCGVGFGFQSPLQDALVGSVPTSAGIRMLYRLSVESPLAFHLSLRAKPCSAEGKLDRSPSSYVRWEAGSAGSEAGEAKFPVCDQSIVER